MNGGKVFNHITSNFSCEMICLALVWHFSVAKSRGLVRIIVEPD